MRLDQLKRAMEEGTPFKMCQFEHVEGCTVCKDLYGHYTLPDGRTIHYYLNDNLNEVVSLLLAPWDDLVVADRVDHMPRVVCSRKAKR